MKMPVYILGRLSSAERLSGVSRVNGCINNVYQGILSFCLRENI